MDGFEVCARLRQTAPNGSTPVLFVTALKDLTHAPMAGLGRQRPHGQPFLTFEITLKALTLVSRARLHRTGSTGEAAGASAVRWPVLSPAMPATAHPAAPAGIPREPARAGAPADADLVFHMPPPIFADQVATDSRPGRQPLPVRFRPRF